MKTITIVLSTIGAVVALVALAHFILDRFFGIWIFDVGIKWR